MNTIEIKVSPSLDADGLADFRDFADSIGAVNARRVSGNGPDILSWDGEVDGKSVSAIVEFIDMLTNVKGLQVTARIDLTGDMAGFVVNASNGTAGV